MLPIETVLAFVTASVLLALAPGPDNIFVLTQSAISGRLSGILVTLGLCTGLIFHTLAVAIGVSVIFQVSALAFTGLKIAGACYLLYLAYQTFRASATEINGNNDKHLTSKELYRRGIFMNITNPKVAIFFMAFLPQFTNPEFGSIPMQMIQLGILFLFSALVVFSTIAIVAGFLREWLVKSPGAQKIINRFASLIFVGLAMKLIVTER